jgi:SAM-dependent methyltransferase
VGLRLRRIRILELGVWKGDSLAMWRDAFPRATIVGVDLHPPQGLDLGPRVTVVAGDQSDGELLGRIRAEHAPDGFDVIVDDASHIGVLTARSLQILFGAHLKPGGLYFIEDWGTGYVASWDDGADPSAVIGAPQLDEVVDEQTPGDETGPVRFPSHDAGMVGLIKRLVDHTASTTLGVHQPERLDDLLPIEWLRVHDGVVILKKSR